MEQLDCTSRPSPRANDLCDKQFGQLRVIAYAGRGTKSGVLYWRCLCCCGNYKTATGAALVAGGYASCGCQKRQNLAKANTKHGRSRSREYRAWLAMRYRCENPSCPSYHDYGGRGIRVCRRWASFDAFYSDMGLCPPEHSLERRKNNKGYTPANCCWATSADQNRNRRRHRTAVTAAHTRQRLRAQYAVLCAVRDGRLVRPSRCEDCRAAAPQQVRRIEAHHHRGYAARHRLDVRWLCPKCHGRTRRHPASRRQR